MNTMHPELAKDLDYIEHKLFNDWDAYGAKKPLKTTIKNVRKFLSAWPKEKPLPDKITPDGDGVITLHWIINSRLKLLLSFEKNIAYYGKYYPEFFSKDYKANSKELMHELHEVFS